MYKHFSAKYYQENKERPSNIFLKVIKIFQVHATKISRKIKKKKKMVQYRKKYYKKRKIALL